MLRNLSILFLFTSILYGSNYPYFSKKDFIHIEKNNGRISKNRVKDYQQTVKSIKNYSKAKQLNKVNSYLNQLLPQYDDVIQGKEDYWATPKEFLICGYGDCEDYAIIKYFTLLKLGFDKDKLFITTAREKFIGGYHMVLSYFKEDGKSPLILDNLSFRILDLRKREDLEAEIFINSTGVYTIDKNNKLKKIQRSFHKFKELLQKIKKEES